MNNKEDIESSNVHLWRRWDNSSGPFYRSCAIWPLNRLSDKSLHEHDESVSKPDLEFCTGLERILLRNFPILLPVVAIITFAIEHYYSYFTGFGAHFPYYISFPEISIPYIILGLIAIILIWLVTSQLRAVGILKNRILWPDIIFYGVGALLSLGTVYSIIIIRISDDPSQLQPHITFRAGYFLFLFISGYLVYDGLVLRVENLFSNLDQSNIVDSEPYNFFKADLKRALNARVDIPEVGIPYTELQLNGLNIKRSYIFASLMMIPPAYFSPPPAEETITLPFVTLGLGFFSLVLISVFAFLSLIVLFQFIVLIFYFDKLLSDNYSTPKGELSLQYNPFHPDGQGGFRPLGLFATRINAILFISGLYVVFRFYTGGLTVFPATKNLISVEFLWWIITYLGPIFLYIIVISAWLYLSFWKMHKKMKRERRKKIEAWQPPLERKDTAGDRSSSSLDNIESVAGPWRELHQAPVWPINYHTIIGILILDLVPIVLSLLY